jgi:hypothetical protein
MYFCIRDDDTSFFTSPEDLERVYGEVSQWGPISLAVVPFHRAGTSGVVPEKCRRRWSVHPLHENRPLVDYLRMGVAQGRFEIMLHGYHHDELYDRWEFAGGHDLAQRVTHGRQYLEDLLGATIRVFVPPYNSISRQGLRAIARAGLHLAGTRGVRSGWPLLSRKTWVLWSRLRRWRTSGGLGIPWILELGDHREIPGNAVTPASRMQHNEAVFESTLAMGGAFCVATHYWEQAAPSLHAGDPSVGEHLRHLIDRAVSEPRVVWRSVGEVVSESPFVV